MITIWSMRDRYETLKPNNLVASMASMPRRWKDAIRVDPPKDIEQFFNISTADGNPAELVGAVLAQLKVLDDAIRTTSYNVPEAVPAEAAAAAQNLGSGPWPASASEARDELTKTFGLLEERLRQLHTNDWNKSAPVDGSPGQRLSVIQLAQGAARVAATTLPLVERAIRNAAY